MEFTEEMKKIMLKACGTLKKEELTIITSIPRKEVVEFQLANGFKTYKCKEGRQEFTIVAKDLNDANEQATLWNVVVIGTVRTKKK
jgi:hypothetical protein